MTPGTLSTAQSLVHTIQEALQPVEQRLRQHAYLQALEEGRVWSHSAGIAPALWVAGGGGAVLHAVCHSALRYQPTGPRGDRGGGRPGGGSAPYRAGGPHAARV